MDEKILCLVSAEGKTWPIETGREYVVGRSDAADIQILDAAVSRRHSLVVREDRIVRINDLKSANGTYVNGKKIVTTELQDGDTVRLGTTNVHVTILTGFDKDGETQGDTVIIERKIDAILQDIGDPGLRERILDLKASFEAGRRKLTGMAFRDQLTGLNNRRYFDQTIGKEISRAKRYERELTLALIDIDHFKDVNDTYGHLKGDNVLATIASVLMNSSREADIVCRFGGEEIALLLPETSPANARLLAEKLRVKIASVVREIDGISVTVSIGLAGCSGECANAHDLVRAADAALYTAKKAGRDRVAVHGIL